MTLIGLTNIKYELDKLELPQHILFTGPRGCGKTTVAEYIADSKNRKLIFATGNTLKKSELLGIFININEGDILLIDEIHRLTPAVEEMLYHPMEKFRLPVKDVAGTFQVLPLPKFSLIGTTTKASKLSKPLVSRFGLHIQIPHYTVRDLARIINQHHPNLSRKNTLKIALTTITPREAINLSNRVLSLVKNDLNKEVDFNLQFIGYKYGLSQAERYYLFILHNVGKISLNSLSSALQLDKEEITFIEDKLIRKGYIEITSRGRTLTIKGLLKVKEIKNG